jgi:hypothetical protein
MIIAVGLLAILIFSDLPTIILLLYDRQSSDLVRFLSIPELQFYTDLCSSCIWDESNNRLADLPGWELRREVLSDPAAILDPQSELLPSTLLNMDDGGEGSANDH